MRSWLGGRTERVPADVLLAAKSLGLPPREQVLAHTRAEDGTWLLATRHRLAVVPPNGGGLVLPWERVQRADWSQKAGRLTVQQVPEGRTTARARRTRSRTRGSS